MSKSYDAEALWQGWYDPTPAPKSEVLDPGVSSRPTGILNADGRMIHCVERMDPVGFVRFPVEKP